MKKITTLLLAILMVLPALAVDLKGGEVLYLTPNSNWNVDNARFAAYFFGNGNAWVDAVPAICKGVGDTYQVTAPNGNWTNVIFCRMNPNASANEWNNAWNQTSDLTYDGTKNHYTVSAGAWSNGAGTWSEYKPSTPVVTLVGAFNSWDKTATELNADGKVYTAFIDKFAGEFKIIIDGAWFGQGYENVNNAVSFELGTGNNMKWNGAEGAVKVVVNMIDPAKYPVLTITEIAPLPTGEFEANIAYGMYYLSLGESDVEGATWYAAHFVNANNGNGTWVYCRRVEDSGLVGVHFGLKDQNNTYTHIAFCAMMCDAPVFNEEKGELEDVGSAEKLMNWEFVYAHTDYVTYVPATIHGNVSVYNYNDKVWEEVNPDKATALDRVEAANGIGYAYGVVSAEGAIEVYNVNGAVVARGNNNVDLRGLGRGVYIIRTGNQVRKVVR